MNSYPLMILFLWPAILISATLLNMLISWTFSWSELIFCYLAGIVIGAFFMVGTEPDAPDIIMFFLTFSHGFFGLLAWTGSEAFATRETLLFWSAGYMLVGVVLSALLDRVTVTIGTSMNIAGGLLSILQIVIKAPFTLMTSAISFIIFFLISGIWVSLFKSTARLGFLGGAPYIEWNYGGANSFATTLGITINTWKGDLAPILGHELYHTRQYMIFRDWFIPFWLLGGIWGWISAAVSTEPWSSTYFFVAHPSKEIGNPLECAAYHSGGTNPF